MLDVKHLKQHAIRKTGLEDFGPDDFDEPLALLVNDYNTSANLNLMGQLGVRIYLRQLLTNRLRLVAKLKLDSVASEPITRPIFILGLPRTGSTLLHELLALHSRTRAPLFWETASLPEKDRSDRWRRLRGFAQVKAVDFLSPGFRGVHPLGAIRPHECVTIQAVDFRSMQFHASHRVTAYNKWIQTCDWGPTYEVHRQYLQWLQQGTEAPRWVLKAPGHLLAPEALFNSYPDASFIQLHRAPEEVLPSMASLYLHLRKPFSRKIDPEEIGADVCEEWSGGLRRTLSFRQQHPGADRRFLDINYKEVTSDPVRVVKKICEFTDLPFDAGYRSALERHLAENPKDKHGKHQYTLAQYGLSEQQVRESFSGIEFAVPG